MDLPGGTNGFALNRRQFLRGTAVGTPVSAWAPAAFSMQARGGDGQGKVGFAERDISPDIGMEQPGGYGKAYLRKFHDACKVRAVVFDDSRKRVALVGVDALMIPRDLVLAARKQIQQRCGIEPEAVLIGASHSHSSGPTGMVQPGEYDFASPLVKMLAYEKSSCADAGYLERVQTEVITAVCHANSLRVDAQCGFGSGREERVVYNRRFRMKNGLTYTHPGQGNPDVLEYAGPIDPEVGVIGSWDKSGRLQGCVVNYACHATTNPDGISANWIYYLEKMIRGALGADVIVVFLQGASGDITQVDNLSPYEYPGGEDWARLVGGRVGAEAIKTLLTMHAGSFSPLDAASTVLQINRRVPSPERVRACAEVVQKSPEAAGNTRWTFAKEIMLLDAILAKHPLAEAEVQAVQVGPAVFLSNPAELFCQFGLDLKSHSPFKFTYPVELANGTVGYVPTEEALSSHGGGYETRLTSYSNLGPTAGRQMVEAALELAGRMKPGKLPEAPRAPSFKSGEDGRGSGEWSYGNVPPELS
jgi:neutral ceramidase